MKRANIVSRTAKVFKRMVEKKAHLEGEISKLRSEAQRKSACIALNSFWDALNPHLLTIPPPPLCADIQIDDAATAFAEKIKLRSDASQTVPQKLTNYVKAYEISQVTREPKQILETGAKSIGEIFLTVSVLQSDPPLLMTAYLPHACSPVCLFYLCVPACLPACLLANIT